MSWRTWREAWIIGCVAGLALVVLPATGAAQGEANPGAPASGGALQDYLRRGESAPTESKEYVTFDVKDKDLNEVLSFIGSRIGVNIIADPEVKEKVTLQLDRVDWRNALDVIARQTNCKVVEVNDRLIRFTQPPSISMEFQDADIKVVLDLLAKQSGQNIVIASDVQGKVSLSLREVPWREALQTVVETAGFTTVKAGTTTGGEILRVVRPESLKDQLYTEYFPLVYIRPNDPYIAIISDVEKYTVSTHKSGASGSLEGPGGANSGDAYSRFSLEEALRDTISKEGTLKYDEHTNTFIVKDTKPKLDEIRDIVKRVDVKPSQVFVEVKFVRTRNQDILQRGVLYDLPGTPQRDGFQVALKNPGPGSYPGVPGAPIDPLYIFGGTYPFDWGALGTFEDAFQSLGVLDFTGTQAILKLIKDDEHSRIVQEPTLTMLDNKPATIFVGDEVPFAVQKVQQDQNGNSTVSIEENKRSPINVGFTLYLIPHVISGTDMINLTVVPKVSTLSGTTSPIEGFERFSFDASGNAAIIDLPRQSLQTVVTHLRVHDGHTAVIGGLQTERRIEIESRIPILSSIPILGQAFMYRSKDSQIESIIILITPHIVKNAADEDLRSKEVLRRHQEKDYFYQKYEKPEEEEGEAEPSEAPRPVSGGDRLETEASS